jgi:hypothetical protein
MCRVRGREPHATHVDESGCDDVGIEQIGRPDELGDLDGSR